MLHGNMQANFFTENLHTFVKIQWNDLCRTLQKKSCRSAQIRKDRKPGLLIQRPPRGIRVTFFLLLFLFLGILPVSNIKVFTSIQFEVFNFSLATNRKRPLIFIDFLINNFYKVKLFNYSSRMNGT